MGRSLKYNSLYRFFVIVWLSLKSIIKIYIFHVTHRIWDHQTRKKWNMLLRNIAKEYRAKAVKLGGVLIKAGQFLSTRADFLPDVFIKELTGLVDRVPPMTFDYARWLLEKEWQTDIHTHLQAIGKKPIASASIGEVYKATLHDGTPVAIKVQRYRVEDIFHMDFKALRMVFWIISAFTSMGKKADLKALYHELIYVMDRELDFEQELEYAMYFKERYKENKQIHIPAYHKRLCTKRVLVMEWIDGVKITDAVFQQQHGIDSKQLAKALFYFYLDQFLNDGYFHADPHAGNILVQKNGVISIIDFGMVSDISKQDTHYFKRLVRGLIMDDYDIVLEALEEMDMVLPYANKKKLKKVIRQMVEIYQNGSFKHMNAHVMKQLQEDIRTFVKDEPIQLPADYAYLGRAASIISGILIALYPGIDMAKWAKPKIKEWYGGKGFSNSIYAEIAKETAQPFLAFPNAMLEWLQSGEKDRQWDKEKQHAVFMHHFYLLLEGFMFAMILACGLVFFYIGSYTLFGGIAGVVFLLGFILTLGKHRRFIKYQK